jgi:pyrroloquinoline-quinone synthase
MTHPALAPEAFVGRLRDEGRQRYHDRHPFHVRMHEGKLSRDELQRWVLNRFYYQTRIPIKDALIVSKSPDPAWRRTWMRRIVDHDGARDGEGGLEAWLRLAEGVGLERDVVRSCDLVRPAVRFACDAYVTFVREHSLLEAVASSLTEFFAPEIMSQRLEAWHTHYTWVQPEALEYFRGRVTRAKQDSAEALDFVLRHATTSEQQDACVAALIRKTEILWSMLDGIAA